MNESELQKLFIFPIYPRDSKIYLDEGFVKIDNGSLGGSSFFIVFFFIVKDNKSYYFDSFGGQPDEILLKQFFKTI